MLFQIRQAFKARRGIKIHYWQAKLVIIITILLLGLIILLHEFGHFWFAKRFGCRVEKFYLFFDFGLDYSSSSKKFIS